jgi:subfamily B ATP-binding cassette protein MsbA
MKRIFELLKPHSGRLVLGALASLAVSALNGSLAWIVKPVVDDIFVSGNKAYLLPIAAAVTTVFILRGIFEYVQNYIMNSIGAKIVRDIRDRLYSHMVYLPMGHFASDTTGAMMSRVITDAGLLQSLLAYRVKDLFVSSATIVILTGIAFYRRWDLTIIALVVLPFAFFAVGRLGKRLKRVSERAQKKIADLTGSISEGLTGIKIIKSFGMEDRDSGRFSVKNQSYYREFMRSVRIIEATSLVMEVVAGAGVAFIIYYGGSLVADRVITSGDFFSFLTAILMIYTPAKRLAQVYNGLQQARAYIGRIDGIFTAEKEPQGSLELPGISQGLAYENVTFKYDGREEDAVRGVSLEVRKGEVVALVGRSGSGKTTLVDLLARFYVPQKGSIRIDGHDIKDATLGSLRSQIGIVSQNVILFNDTVRANIAFGRPDAPEADILKAARAAFAHEFITQLPLGYDTPLGEGGALLSGGQRQRISIARAILKNPPILILDEATSSLDTQSELMVQRALDRLVFSEDSTGEDPVETTRKTIFIIAHRLSTVQRADRIIVLDMGRVAEAGTHGELLRREGLYRQLYNLQYGHGEGG